MYFKFTHKFLIQLIQFSYKFNLHHDLAMINFEFLGNLVINTLNLLKKLEINIKNLICLGYIST